jgi:thymidine kinase
MLQKLPCTHTKKIEKHTHTETNGVENMLPILSMWNSLSLPPTPSEKKKSYGEIQLLVGPMFSEKTTELQRVIRRYALAKKNTLIFKYAKDDARYGKNCVTHNGHEMEAVSVLTLLPYMDMVRTVSVIGVDEAQFFPDLIPFCREMVELGKIVIAAGLDGTFERKPFSSIMNLIPFCKKVKKLSAICACCGDEAAFTRRLSSEKEVEIIGDITLYHANCEFCFNIPLLNYLELTKVLTVENN